MENPRECMCQGKDIFSKIALKYWHNLFNNEACQKALNLWKRKCSLAPTKLKTVRINRKDRQWPWHSLKTVSSRCLGFWARIVCKGIMNWHFKRLFSEITSVCRTILRFIKIFPRCNKETLICRTDLCPGIHFRLKVILSWMEKRSFLCKCYHHILIKTGLRRLNWVVSYQ